MSYNRNQKHSKNFQRKPKERTPQVFGNKVVVIDGNVDQALRKLKKKISNSGLMQELRDREHYEKPTQKRKVAKAMAKKREQKRVAKDTLNRKRKY